MAFAGGAYDHGSQGADEQADDEGHEWPAFRCCSCFFHGFFEGFQRFSKDFRGFSGVESEFPSVRKRVAHRKKELEAARAKVEQEQQRLLSATQEASQQMEQLRTAERELDRFLQALYHAYPSLTGRK